jgi:hypothetical protein
MGEQALGVTAREFCQRELDAAKKRLAAMENGWAGDSGGVSLDPSSAEEINRFRALVARLTRELAEENVWQT